MAASDEHVDLRLPYTSRFFVAELQTFCRVYIGLKFVGTSACRTLVDFLSRLSAFSLGAESISAMFEKRLVVYYVGNYPRYCIGIGIGIGRVMSLIFKLSR